MRAVESLSGRARGKFYSVMHVLTSSAPLMSRIRLLHTAVFGVLRWIVGPIFPSPQIQSIINYFHYNCVRKMMNLKRGRDELWVQYEARTIRVTRAMTGGETDTWRPGGSARGIESGRVRTRTRPRLGLCLGSGGSQGGKRNNRC